VLLLPKPSKAPPPAEAAPAIPPELDFPPVAPPMTEKGVALGWLRAVAGAVSGGFSSGGGGGGGGSSVRVPRGAGRSIEWGAPEPGERAAAAASSSAEAGEAAAAEGAEGTPAWALQTPAAEAERASRAAELALKRVLAVLTPLSIGASACSALLGVAAVAAPWYGHTVPGEENCEIWYSMLSQGWEGDCSPRTRATNPPFGGIQANLNSAALLAAGTISSLGAAAGGFAVASAACQRAAVLRLGSPRYKHPRACGSACALLALTSLELALTSLGALVAGATFEYLVNTNALISIDTFGGGRSIADAASVLAAVAVALAALTKLRLRKFAQEAKQDEARWKAERLLGLPAHGAHPCC
jgi:hypothetical protein